SNGAHDVPSRSADARGGGLLGGDREALDAHGRRLDRDPRQSRAGAGDARTDRAAPVPLGLGHRPLCAGRGLLAVRRQSRARARRGGDCARRRRSPDVRDALERSARSGRAGRRGQRAQGARAARRPPLRSVPRGRRVVRGRPVESASSDHFKRPGWFTKNVFNRAVAVLTRLGVSVWGSRVLEVRGRTSGGGRQTPVNLVTIDGQRYLVSPRGQSQWVRNMRVSGGGRLRIGPRSESFTATELLE